MYGSCAGSADPRCMCCSATCAQHHSACCTLHRFGYLRPTLAATSAPHASVVKAVTGAPRDEKRVQRRLSFPCATRLEGEARAINILLRFRCTNSEHNIGMCIRLDYDQLSAGGKTAAYYRFIAIGCFEFFLCCLLPLSQFTCIARSWLPHKSTLQDD